MDELIIPKVKKVGYFFMSENFELKKLYAPELEIIEDVFLRKNEIIEELYMPKVKEITKNFISGNMNIKNIELPYSLINKINNVYIKTLLLRKKKEQLLNTKDQIKNNLNNNIIKNRNKEVEYGRR